VRRVPDDLDCALNVAKDTKCRRVLTVGSDCNLGMQYTIMELNPGLGTGKVAYSWAAGTGDENARSFVTDVSISGSQKTGSGWAGFGDRLNNIIDGRDNTLPADRKISNLSKFICN